MYQADKAGEYKQYAGQWPIKLKLPASLDPAVMLLIVKRAKKLSKPVGMPVNKRLESLNYYRLKALQEVSWYYWILEERTSKNKVIGGKLGLYSPELGQIFEVPYNHQALPQTNLLKLSLVKTGGELKLQVKHIDFWQWWHQSQPPVTFTIIVFFLMVSLAVGLVLASVFKWIFILVVWLFWVKGRRTIIISELSEKNKLNQNTIRLFLDHLDAEVVYVLIINPNLAKAYY